MTADIAEPPSLLSALTLLVGAAVFTGALGCCLLAGWAMQRRARA
jgi:hypothetical protein